MNRSCRHNHFKVIHNITLTSHHGLKGDMPHKYITILKNGTCGIPQQIRDEVHIKEGDVILIQIEKVHGKENMPKHKKVIIL